MFYLDSTGNYRTSALDAFEWLIYGFGTRNSAWPSPLATLHQVHSDIVIAADGRTGCLGDGDALISNTPWRMVAVKTADCLPIFLIDPANHALAAVHAGWRGTVRRICRQSAEAMCRHFGTRPAELFAAIGPGIGECCFEVGAEVSAEFGRSGRVHIDLEEVNRRELLDAGVPAAHIHVAKLCTACRPGDFWSFRRDKQAAGRMLSFVGLRDPSTTVCL